MNTSIKFESTIDLPQVLSDFLYRNQLIAFNNGLLANYGLAEGVRGVVGNLEIDLVLRAITVEDLPREIGSRLKITDSDKIRSIAQDIYNEFCGPIRWYFPKLGERLSKMGFVLNATDLFPLEQPKTTLAEAVADIMGKIGDLPKSIKPRVESLVQNTLQKQVCDSEAVERELLTPVTEGGIGLGDYNARTIVMALEDYVAVYAFSDVPDSDVAAPKKNVGPQLDAATLPKDILADEEVSELGAAGLVAETISTSNLSSHQKTLVDAVLAAEPLSDRSEDLQKRWKTIVEARIGGARDAAKTKILLTTGELAGGLGLSDAEAERLVQLLEQTAGGFEKRREDFAQTEKIESVKKQAQEIMAGPEAADRSRQQELNERFVALFGKGAVEEMRKETRREIESPEKAHPGEHERTHVAPINLNPSTAQAPTISAPTPAVQSNKSESSPTSAVPVAEPKYIPKVPDKLRALIDAENPVFPIKPAQPPQKKSADIRPGLKLVGPIDELRLMTMVDFRRLSDDVSVRIQKIRSRIDVIAQDGPHEKIRAIQAFEQSEPVRLYREILKRSLIEQKSVEQLAGEYKEAKKDYLSEDEMMGLRQFLTQIRYSSM